MKIIIKEEKSCKSRKYIETKAMFLDFSIEIRRYNTHTYLSFAEIVDGNYSKKIYAKKTNGRFNCLKQLKAMNEDLNLELSKEDIKLLTKSYKEGSSESGHLKK